MFDYDENGQQSHTPADLRLQQLLTNSLAAPTNMFDYSSHSPAQLPHSSNSHTFVIHILIDPTSMFDYNGNYQKLPH